MTTGSDDELAGIIQSFLAESRDNLDQFELSLLELEADASSSEALQAAFRAVHSIKGACGFLGFAKIEAVTHAGETVLGRARDGTVAIDEVATTVLLRMIDVVRRLLLDVEHSGAEGDAEIDSVVEALGHVARVSARGIEVVERIHRGEGVARPDDLRAFAASDHTVRVDTRVLEHLMNLVGELVLARNQLAQSTANGARASLTAASQRLNLITSEIQEVAMKTRMQPMGSLWSRFPRMVRELARTTGKHVRIEMSGQRTELDRTLLEALQDPLVHLLRNAVDHGIETPETRTKQGKPAVGVVRLGAYHEGGLVIVEFADDGRGLDVDAIRRQAVRRGLVTSDQAERMAEREAFSLVFLPGFSTTEATTHLSGRGVGLDVVRSNVEQMGGTVDLHSRVGGGTTFKLKIPLTLAIIPALLISAGGERFAIPQASLLEVLRLDPEKARTQIESVQGGDVMRLRGRLLPLVHLHRELALPLSAMPADEGVSILVLQADDRSFGLVVDGIGETEEVVVKPLWKRLKGLAVYAGATVLGDGHVALILDTLGLAQRVGVVADERATRDRTQDRAVGESGTVATQQLLLCGLRGGGRLAIPLGRVARLEELPAATVERTGDAEVVQYRGTILPLVRVASALEERRSRDRHPAAPPSSDELLQVVVCSSRDRSVGLVLESIFDIVDTDATVQTGTARRGVLGSMVILGRVTELLDVDSVLARPRTAPVGSSGASADGGPG